MMARIGGVRGRGRRALSCIYTDKMQPTKKGTQESSKGPRRLDSGHRIVHLTVGTASPGEPGINLSCKEKRTKQR